MSQSLYSQLLTLMYSRVESTMVCTAILQSRTIHTRMTSTGHKWTEMCRMDRNVSVWCSKYRAHLFQTSFWSLQPLGLSGEIFPHEQSVRRLRPTAGRILPDVGQGFVERQAQGERQSWDVCDRPADLAHVEDRPLRGGELCRFIHKPNKVTGTLSVESACWKWNTLMSWNGCTGGCSYNGHISTNFYKGEKKSVT